MSYGVSISRHQLRLGTIDVLEASLLLRSVRGLCKSMQEPRYTARYSGLKH